MSSQQTSQTRRSLTGFVTKLVGDGATYGFINDEIFFPQTNVSGGPAQVGDQVFADCEYSAHMPIKWNATSVKIINKSTGQQPINNSGLDSQQQQQGLMSQQNFNQAPQVAMTYQQHRLQRQQQQMVDQQLQQQDAEMKQSQSNIDQSASIDPRAFAQPQQTSDNNIQPFQDQSMGPPNFAFTSQLGSAFVQNQPFAPPPFLAQAPPQTLLPQQQQQNLLPTNQNNSRFGNNNNNNNNQHNKGRFGNQADKNERNQNPRRNPNRNDSKFDRPRSGEREGGLHRQSRGFEGRDRSGNRNTKRDDIPTRPSPPQHSSSRSSTSISSDKPAKSKKHYEAQNIPKTLIMTNMSAHGMKQRCPSSVHVPSDLKEVFVNPNLRLDIKNTPKPLRYTIGQTKQPELVGADQGEAASENQSETEASERPSAGPLEQSQQDDISNVVKNEKEVKELPTPPSSRSETRLNHKYGVKVILLSLPEIEEIYHSVFGPQLDSYNSDGKSHSKLDEVVGLLCNKGSNNGHSLIGCKFDQSLDGFSEGETNQFERHGKQPDLIATCKRAVLEQAGLDLSECHAWTLVSAFIYNNKSDYFSPKASIEYSFIYMPHIWTLDRKNFDKSIKQANLAPASKTECAADDDVKIEAETSEDGAVKNEDANADDETPATEPVESEKETVAEAGISSTTHLENLGELKVTDLKAELEKRNIKYKGSPKKAELVALLQEALLSEVKAKEVSPMSISEDKLDGGQVLAQVGSTAQPSSSEITEAESQQYDKNVEDQGDSQVLATEVSSAIGENETVGAQSAVKRKAPDSESQTADESSNKKTKADEEVPCNKEMKVKLISDSFAVHSRSDQQQLSVVSLHEACQAGKHDQFELSVSSNILKESMVQHFSEFILTALVEDNKQRSTIAATSSDTGGNSTSSSDSNNNSDVSTAQFKNPSVTTEQTRQSSNKDLPVDRYIMLALSFFDSNHLGYLYSDDLIKLFNNTGLTISKRALASLIGDGDKFNYRSLPDFSMKSNKSFTYQFPEQFQHLPGLGSKSNLESRQISSKTIVHNGVTYDIAKLVGQAQELETMRVSLVDRFNHAIEGSDKQAEEIHVLEVSQKSLSKAIKAQNDEICDLKRERDSLKKKNDHLRKAIKGSITSLSDAVKEDK